MESCQKRLYKCVFYFRSISPTELESISCFVIHQISVIPLPCYSFLAADTLRELVALTFDLLTLVSGHTWRVTYSTPPPSFKILWLSVLELWIRIGPISHKIWPRMRLQTLCMPYHVTYAYRQQIFSTYLKSLTPICLFTEQLVWPYD